MNTHISFGHAVKRGFKMAFTFKGGILPQKQKNTKKCPITPITPPARVFIPLSAPTGGSCTPCVRIGDTVKKGQVIAQSAGAVFYPVHASISGKVTDFSEIPLPCGKEEKAAVIENDYKNQLDSSVLPCNDDIRALSVDTILEKIRNAGIVDPDYHSLPIHDVLCSATGSAKALIINCTESDPFITARYRLLKEHPEKIVGGIKILLKALCLRSAVIALDQSMPDVLKILENIRFEKEMIRICIMKSKYPQGAEKQLVYALSGKEVPCGKTALDLGYLLLTAECCFAVYDAFASGSPMTDTVVTVDGDCISTPENLLVPIGTSAEDLLLYCGAKLTDSSRLLFGNPISGQPFSNIATPITHKTHALLACSSKNIAQTPCIRCGKCLAVCPMGLMPREIHMLAQKKDLSNLKKLHSDLCIACGCCSYICPAGISLMQSLKDANELIQKDGAVSKDAESPIAPVKGGHAHDK